MRRVMENQSLPTPSVRASSLINPPSDDDNGEFSSFHQKVKNTHRDVLIRDLRIKTLSSLINSPGDDDHGEYLPSLS